MDKQFLYPKDEGNTYVNDVKQGKIKMGWGIQCELDHYLRYKAGSFNVILGHRNLGKSAWINWYATVLYFAYGIRPLIFSSENKIGHLKRDIVSFMDGKKIKAIDDKRINAYLRHISEDFSFVDTRNKHTCSSLLKSASEIQDSFDMVIIDPYNSLSKEKGFGGFNGHEYDYEMASEIRRFCQNTGKSVYLPMHAVTEALRNKHQGGEFAGHISPPTDGQAEGGGKWSNRCDDFIVLHRYSKHESKWMETRINVEKVKDTETGGKPTEIEKEVIMRFGKEGDPTARCFMCKPRNHQEGTKVELIDPMEWAKARWIERKGGIQL